MGRPGSKSPLLVWVLLLAATCAADKVADRESESESEAAAAAAATAAAAGAKHARWWDKAGKGPAPLPTLEFSVGRSGAGRGLNDVVKALRARPISSSTFQ